VPAQILIVVVEYATPIENAPVIQSLDCCFSQDPTLLEDFATLVWDNSPHCSPLPRGLCFPLEYWHTGVNLGVAGAYNRAAELAAEYGARWLLLLDQDTVLPAEFLPRMRNYAQCLAPRHKIAAVAPIVTMGYMQVSPKVMASWGRSIDPPTGFSGEESRELVLVNTGLLLRLEAFSQIGGYDPDFWLDFSDRYLCHMLAQKDFSVWLAPDLQLQHHVSLIADDLSLSRYANFVSAEDAFFTLYRTLPRNIVYCQRLLRKAWRERKTNPQRTRLLLRHLARRFTASKNRRIREWRLEAAAARRAMPS
jgi:GT2 family glycosyltransferase